MGVTTVTNTTAQHRDLAMNLSGINDMSILNQSNNLLNISTNSSKKKTSKVRSQGNNH